MAGRPRLSEEEKAKTKAAREARAEAKREAARQLAGKKKRIREPRINDRKGEYDPDTGLYYSVQNASPVHVDDMNEHQAMRAYGVAYRMFLLGSFKISWTPDVVREKYRNLMKFKDYLVSRDMKPEMYRLSLRRRKKAKREMIIPPEGFSLPEKEWVAKNKYPEEQYTEEQWAKMSEIACEDEPYDRTLTQLGVERAVLTPTRLLKIVLDRNGII